MNRNERTVSFADLAVQVWKRRKYVLLPVLAVILAAVLLSVKDIQGYRETGTVPVKTENEKLYRFHQAASEHLGRQYDSLLEYMPESIYGKIDNYHKYVGTQVYYVQADKAETGAAGAIALKEYVKGTIEYGSLAEIVGLKDDFYVRQMVETSEAEGSTVKVIVNGDSQEHVQAVMDHVSTEMEAQADTVLSVLGDVTCVKVTENIREIADTGFNWWTLDTQSMIKNYDNGHANAEAVLNGMRNETSAGAAWSVSDTAKYIIRRCVKYGLVSAVLAVLAVIAVLLKKETVLSEEEASETLGLPVLGDLGKERDLSLETLSYKTDGNKPLVFLGDPGTQAEILQKAIGDRAVFLRHPLDPEERKQITEDAQMILLVRSGVSSYQTLRKLTAYIADRKAEITGMFFL